MSYPPSQKPPIWSIDPGVIAYNCQNAGMPHPVLAMPMWEGAGGLARDYSGHGNHGTINGADWEIDELSFNGTDGYVDFGSFVPVSGNDARTFLLWFDANRYSNLDTIVSYGTSSPGKRWTIRLEDSSIPGAIRTEVYGGYNYGSTNLIPLGRVFVACVFNGSTTLDVVHYVNGEIETVGASSEMAINTGTTKGLNLGREHVLHESDRFFSGSFAGFCAYDTDLSAAQIKFINENPYFMYQIPEELYGYVAGAPPTGNPAWYYNMLRRRN